MRVFRLTPIDPKELIWGLSSACRTFLVRAEDERAARRVVGECCAFGQAENRPTAAPLAPWCDPEFVLAEPVDVPVDVAVGEATWAAAAILRPTGGDLQMKALG